jgi:hypothetical protein
VTDPGDPAPVPPQVPLGLLAWTVLLAGDLLLAYGVVEREGAAAVACIAGGWTLINVALVLLVYAWRTRRGASLAMMMLTLVFLMTFAWTAMFATARDGLATTVAQVAPALAAGTWIVARVREARLHRLRRVLLAGSVLVAVVGIAFLRTIWRFDPTLLPIPLFVILAPLLARAALARA